VTVVGGEFHFWEQGHDRGGIPWSEQCRLPMSFVRNGYLEPRLNFKCTFKEVSFFIESHRVDTAARRHEIRPEAYRSLEQLGE